MKVTNARLFAAYLVALLSFFGGAARAQETLWDHNGSIISWTADGEKRVGRYVKPRAGLDGLVSAGDVLFEGTNDGNKISGTAYVFKRGCEPAGYEVSGTSTGERFELDGRAPVFASVGCEVVGADSTHKNAHLVFTLIKSETPVAEKAPSETPDDATASDQATTEGTPTIEDRTVTIGDTDYNVRFPAAFKLVSSDDLVATFRTADGVELIFTIDLEGDGTLKMSYDLNLEKIGGTPFYNRNGGDDGYTLFGDDAERPGYIRYVYAMQHDCGTGTCPFSFFVRAPASKKAYIEAFVRPLISSTDDLSAAFELAAAEKRRTEEAREREREAAERRAREAEANRNSVTFEITSNDPYTIGVEFVSSTRNAAWPGGNQSYIIDRRGKTYTYRLNCRQGEKICFGAWRHPNASWVWGIGQNSQHGCTGCCLTCGQGTHGWTLTAGSEPSPVARNDGAEILGSILSGAAAGLAVGGALSGGQTYNRPRASPPPASVPQGREWRGSGISGTR